MMTKCDVILMIGDDFIKVLNPLAVGRGGTARRPSRQR